MHDAKIKIQHTSIVIGNKSAKKVTIINFIKIPPYFRICKTIFSLCRLIFQSRRDEYLMKPFPIAPRQISSSSDFFVRVVRRGREVIQPESVRRGFEHDPIAFHRTPLIRHITITTRDSLTHGDRFHDAAFPPGPDARHVLQDAPRAYLRASPRQ